MAALVEGLEVVESAFQEMAREPLAPRPEGVITGFIQQLDALLRSSELANVRQAPSAQRAHIARRFQRLADDLREQRDAAELVERRGGQTPWMRDVAEAVGRMERQLRQRGLPLAPSSAPPPTVFRDPATGEFRLKEQIDAIKQARDAEIAAINKALANALKDNALARLETYITIAAQAAQLGKPDEARKELLELLRTVFGEVSQPGWDGYDALPVSGGTLAKALAFLHLLPSALMSPEISAHPDGELAFEWYVGPRWLLTISISEAGRLSYAGLFGTARVHGTEWLLNNSIPQPVALAFERFLSGITAA